MRQSYAAIIGAITNIGSSVLPTPMPAFAQPSARPSLRSNQRRDRLQIAERPEPEPEHRHDAPRAGNRRRGSAGVK